MAGDGLRRGLRGTQGPSVRFDHRAFRRLRHGSALGAYAEQAASPHAKSQRRRTTTGAKPPGHHLPDSRVYDVPVNGTRTRALVGSFVFFLVAPAVVAGVGPFILVGWTMQPPLLGLPGERVVGVVAAAAGLVCLLDCFARFALEGRGTPAPVAQTEVLVATGLYRFVRNPMYVCVAMIVSGQALLFGQAWLFAYAAVLLVIFHLFVLFYEEPTLRRRFGESYETYSLHVGRWWPRLTPWRGSGTSPS